MTSNFQFNFEGFSTNKPQINEDTLYDFLIIGGGPAGLNAALYAKRKGLETAIITKQIGGQIVNTSTVENYLGTQKLPAKSWSMNSSPMFLNWKYLSLNIAKSLKSFPVPLLTK